MFLNFVVAGCGSHRFLRYVLKRRYVRSPRVADMRISQGRNMQCILYCAEIYVVKAEQMCDVLSMSRTIILS